MAAQIFFFFTKVARFFRIIFRTFISYYYMSIIQINIICKETLATKETTTTTTTTDLSETATSTTTDLSERGL